MPKDIPGSIAPADLHHACQQLLEHWRSTNADNDLSIEFRGEPDEPYLALSHALNALNSHPNAASASLPEVEEARQDETPDPLSDIEDEEDQAAIHHSPSSHPSPPTVFYNIIYSPTYRVPVLYFSLHHLPPSSSSSPKGRRDGIEAVYEYLVPPHQQTSLRDIGVLGGIGMTNHPITDIPCYWVHPCRTAEAMAEILRGVEIGRAREAETERGVKGVNGLEYLMAWMGLVGGAVGLYLPREVVVECMGEG